jgi:hypothetical protein
MEVREWHMEDFEDLSYGETFSFEGVVYMKLEPCDSECISNAVVLHPEKIRGSTYWFDATDVRVVRITRW